MVDLQWQTATAGCALYGYQYTPSECGGTTTLGGAVAAHDVCFAAFFEGEQFLLNKLR